MIDLQDIENKVKARWHDGPKSQLAMSVVSELRKVPEQQLRMLTWNSFGKIASHSIDQDLIEVIMFLAGTQLLEMRFRFIDRDGREFDIPRSEVFESQTSKVLVHPRTGEEIQDFEQFLVPYFVASTDLGSGGQ